MGSESINLEWDGNSSPSEPLQGWPRALSFLVVACLLCACETEPRFVYVLAGEPQVELLVSASETDARVGQGVILRAERTHRGDWKQVEKSTLPAEHCWLGKPPPDREPEVADNLRWEATPPGPAQFNVPYRTDRTREVVFTQPGTYTLESTSVVWCHPKNVKGKTITVRVS